MRYSLQYFNADDMKVFLKQFSNAMLCTLIPKNDKNYDKYRKGFRDNKLPMHILEKIYFEEIHGNIGNKLEKFLIEKIKQKFEHTRIEELVDSVTEDKLLEVVPEIEKEIIHLGLTISPKQVFLLAGYKVETSYGVLMDSYHQLITDEGQRVIQEHESKIVNEQVLKYDKLNKSYEQLKSSMEIVNNTVKDLKELGKQKEVEIESQKEESTLIKEKLLKITLENKVNKDKLRDYEEKSIQIRELTSNVIKLKQQIETLEEEIFNLQGRTFSADIVRELSIDVLDDLRSEEIDENEFINNANQLFNENEQLNQSWEKLSFLEKEKLDLIINKMESDNISNTDIETLDLIENYIHYKYIIVKGLKVLFFSFLEQKSGEKTIDQKFKKS